MRSDTGSRGGGESVADNPSSDTDASIHREERNRPESEVFDAAPRLDPHDKEQDYSFRPGAPEDSKPAHPALDPHAKSGDYTLRPDPEGKHDSVMRNAIDYTSSTNISSRNIATGVTDKASDLADHARQEASNLIDKARGQALDARDYAADKMTQARAQAEDAYRDARGWVVETAEEQRRRAVYATRRGRVHLKRRQSQVETFVHENPLLVGVVGVAAGLLLGSLLPRTRGEDRSIGPYADELRAQGLSYARDAADRGRDFVRHTLDPENIQAAAERAGVEPTSASSVDHNLNPNPRRT